MFLMNKGQDIKAQRKLTFKQSFPKDRNFAKNLFPEGRSSDAPKCFRGVGGDKVVQESLQSLKLLKSA